MSQEKPQYTPGEESAKAVDGDRPAHIGAGKEITPAQANDWKKLADSISKILSRVAIILTSIITIYKFLELFSPTGPLLILLSVVVAIVILAAVYLWSKQVRQIIPVYGVTVIVFLVVILSTRDADVIGSISNSQATPLPEFNLILKNSNGLKQEEKTGSDGAFHFSGVPAGKYSLEDGCNVPLFSGQVPSGWARIINNKVRVGDISYQGTCGTPTITPAWIDGTPDTPTPAPTSFPTPTLTLTPTPACPFQGRSDEETIRNLIQAEAEAANQKSMELILAIFSSQATFYDGAIDKTWNNPVERYQEDLFINTGLKDSEHFDIQPAGAGISGDTAWYTSGSRGFYLEAGKWKEFNNGSLVSPTATAFGSDHWTLQRSNGCWVIVRFAFNSGHIPFP